MIDRTQFQRLGNGVIKYDGLKWQPVQIRKASTCAVTGKVLPAGTEAYKPASTGLGRRASLRISAEVFRG